VFERRVGTRVAVMGTSDVVWGCVVFNLEVWAEGVLWPAMREQYSIGRGPAGVFRAIEEGDLEAKESVFRYVGPKVLNKSPRCRSASQARVHQLQGSISVASESASQACVSPDAGATSKRRMEIELPLGMT
jgi:hypothetical protein